MKVKTRYLLTDVTDYKIIKSLDISDIRIIRNDFTSNIIIKVRLANLNQVKLQFTKHKIKVIKISGTLKSLQNQNLQASGMVALTMSTEPAAHNTFRFPT